MKVIVNHTRLAFFYVAMSAGVLVGKGRGSKGGVPSRSTISDDLLDLGNKALT